MVLWVNPLLFVLSVNCKEFLDKDESQIPVDQVFFHR